MEIDMRTARYVQIFALMATLGLNQTTQLHAQQIVEHAAECPAPYLCTSDLWVH